MRLQNVEPAPWILPRTLFPHAGRGDENGAVNLLRFAYREKVPAGG